MTDAVVQQPFPLALYPVFMIEKNADECAVSRPAVNGNSLLRISSSPQTDSTRQIAVLSVVLSIDQCQVCERI